MPSPRKRGDTKLKEREIKEKFERIQASPCSHPPATPNTKPELQYVAYEQKHKWRYALTAIVNPILVDTSGRTSQVTEYIIRLRFTDASGSPIFNDDTGKPRTRTGRVSVSEETDPTGQFRHTWDNLPMPGEWYNIVDYKAVDNNGCDSEWSPAEGPVLPTDRAVAVPPAPSGVTLNFNRKGGEKWTPFNMKVTWDEVQKWKPPDSEMQDVMGSYEIETQVSENDGQSWDDWKSKKKSAKGDKDENEIATAVFHPAYGRNHYRARVRAITIYGQVSEWGPQDAQHNGWTDKGTPSDSIKPPAPNNVKVNVLQHRITVSWDFEKDDKDKEGGAGSGDTADSLKAPQKDVAYAQVRVSSGANFAWGNLIPDGFDRYVVGTKKSFPVKKPKSLNANGDFSGQVRTSDGSGNKSAWVGNSGTLHKPNTPQKSDITLEIKKMGGTRAAPLKAVVTFTPGSDAEDDWDEFPVQLQGSANATFTENDPRDTKIVPEGEDPDDATEYKAVFKKIRKGWYFRARFRKKSKGRQPSKWSPWTDAIKAVKTGAKPPQPKNVAFIKHYRQVGAEWDPPEDDEGHPSQDVAFYKAQIAENAGFTVGVRTKKHVVNTRAVWKTVKGNTYHVRVWTADDAGDESDPVVAGSGQDEDAEPGPLGPGSIPDLTPFASGIKPVLLWSGASLPTYTNYDEGQVIYWTVDKKLYRRTTGGWSTAIEGTDIPAGTLNADRLVANSITAGQIAAGAISVTQLAAGAVTAEKLSAEVIYGGSFYLGGSGRFSTSKFSVNRIEMLAVPGEEDKIRFLNASGVVTMKSVSVYGMPTIQLGGGGNFRFNPDNNSMLMRDGTLMLHMFESGSFIPVLPATLGVKIIGKKTSAGKQAIFAKWGSDNSETLIVQHP